LKTPQPRNLHPQVHVGALQERSAGRPGLCTALLQHDPVEVCAINNTLSNATRAALRAHCRPAGGAAAAAAGAGAVLSLLSPQLAPRGVAMAKAQLSRALPPEALRAVVGLMQRQWGPGETAGAAVEALALAVGQLQRCGLATEVLPTCIFRALEVQDGVVEAGVGGSGVRGQQQRQHHRQHMLLDDRALCSLHVLQGALGERRGSLLAAIDGTVSAAGRRLLRQWLCRCVLGSQGRCGGIA